MSPFFLEEAIRDRIRKTGKKPKAIIPVHLYGMPAEMDAIMQIAAEYEIPILEDAAEALGSTYKGRKCGTFGEFACLSFNGNKMITTSGGGALVCSTPWQAEKTKFYATQARDKASHYQHSEIGYNYRMSNICAGIGRGQMTVLDEHVACRRAIHRIYAERLRHVAGVSVFENPSSGFQSNHWLTCVLVDPALAGYSREDLQLKMEAANIETRPLWKPMHLQPLYASAPFYGGAASEKLFEHGLCLPSGPAVSPEDMERILDVFLSES
jgi:dTDP-4-amino-4,6-dideoxygalactose transaminase